MKNNLNIKTSHFSNNKFSQKHNKFGGKKNNKTLKPHKYYRRFKGGFSEEEKGKIDKQIKDIEKILDEIIIGDESISEKPIVTKLNNFMKDISLEKWENVTKELSESLKSLSFNEKLESRKDDLINAIRLTNRTILQELINDKLFNIFSEKAQEKEAKKKFDDFFKKIPEQDLNAIVDTLTDSTEFNDESLDKNGKYTEFVTKIKTQIKDDLTNIIDIQKDLNEKITGQKPSDSKGEEPIMEPVKVMGQQAAPDELEGVKAALAAASAKQTAEAEAAEAKAKADAAQGEAATAPANKDPTAAAALGEGATAAAAQGEGATAEAEAAEAKAKADAQAAEAAEAKANADAQLASKAAASTSSEEDSAKKALEADATKKTGQANTQEQATADDRSGCPISKPDKCKPIQELCKKGNIEKFNSKECKEYILKNNSEQYNKQNNSNNFKLLEECTDPNYKPEQLPTNILGEPGIIQPRPQDPTSNFVLINKETANPVSVNWVNSSFTKDLSKVNEELAEEEAKSRSYETDTTNKIAALQKQIKGLDETMKTLTTEFRASGISPKPGATTQTAQGSPAAASTPSSQEDAAKAAATATAAAAKPQGPQSIGAESPSPASQEAAKKEVEEEDDQAPAAAPAAAEKEVEQGEAKKDDPADAPPLEERAPAEEAAAADTPPLKEKAPAAQAEAPAAEAEVQAEAPAAQAEVQAEVQAEAPAAAADATPQNIQTGSEDEPPREGGTIKVNNLVNVDRKKNNSRKKYYKKRKHNSKKR